MLSAIFWTEEGGDFGLRLFGGLTRAKSFDPSAFARPARARSTWARSFDPAARAFRYLLQVFGPPNMLAVEQSGRDARAGWIRFARPLKSAVTLTIGSFAHCVTIWLDPNMLNNEKWRGVNLEIRSFA